jgi:hypothetical protein
LKSRIEKPCAAVLVDPPPFDLLESGANLSVAGLKTVMASAPDANKAAGRGYDGHLPADLYDPGQLAAVSASLSADFAVDFVLGSSETAVIPAAFVAEKTHAKGVTPETAHKCRNKLATREALSEAGVSVPRFPGIADSRHLCNAVAAIGGLPIVCKPLLGFASQGVQKAADLDQLEHAARRIKRMNSFVMRCYQAIGETPSADTVLLEQFLPGQEYAIDAYRARKARGQRVQGTCRHRALSCTRSRHSHGTLPYRGALQRRRCACPGDRRTDRVSAPAESYDVNRHHVTGHQPAA